MASPTDLSPGAKDTDWYVGIDCGGTFTDLMMANGQRDVHVGSNNFLYYEQGNPGRWWSRYASIRRAGMW